MLVVPDKQMEDFMFVMDLNPDGVSLNSEIPVSYTHLDVYKRQPLWISCAFLCH